MTGALVNKKNIFRLKNNGMKKIFLTIMAAAAILAGCQKTPVSAVKTGTLEFSMSSADGSYNDREEGMLDSKSSASGSGVSTKAYDKEAALASMLVTISNKSGVGEPLHSCVGPACFRRLKGIFHNCRQDIDCGARVRHHQCEGKRQLHRRVS